MPSKTNRCVKRAQQKSDNRPVLFVDVDGVISLFGFNPSDPHPGRFHSIDGIPMFTAGKAGGKIKTGMHFDGAGQPNTRLGFTLLRTMGVDAADWGTQSNQTSKEITEIMA